MIAVMKQSGMNSDEGGGPSLLPQIDICWTESNAISAGCCPFWLSVIEIPDNVVGNGKLVALTG